MKTPLFSTEDLYASVHTVELEDGVLGKALNNGNILIDAGIKDADQKKDTINHELGHAFEIKNGDLSYDDENVYYKGKKFKRSTMQEGSALLAWEKFANNYAGKKNKKDGIKQTRKA